MRSWECPGDVLLVPCGGPETLGGVLEALGGSFGGSWALLWRPNRLPGTSLEPWGDSIGVSGEALGYSAEAFGVPGFSVGGPGGSF